MTKNFISNLKWCKKCVMMSTRPRITFDKNGICNACQWTEKKKKINWKKRKEKLFKILDRYRNTKSDYNCIVPVSGGKDGSYIAYNLKHKYNMRPLCVTITPPLELDIGKKNLKNFVSSGYDLITVDIDHDLMRKTNLIGFEKVGFPYFGWLVAIHTAVARVASSFKIPLVFYAEDGEVEYGGTNEKENKQLYNFDYQKKIYLENHYGILKKVINKYDGKYFFEYPKETKNIKLTHWSYYENWDPYRNYLVAKKYCGLQEAEMANTGTFTNFAQNDQAMYTLHTYLMYLKFGFGRASQDACIEIRRGAMDRDQAINLVNLYDGYFPDNYEIYLDYYKINKSKFNSILKKFTNKKLFTYKNNIVTKLFQIT